MPAQRAYRPQQFEDNLKIWVEGDLEPRFMGRLLGNKNVYFTDQSPTFTVVVENTGDQRIINGETFVRLSFTESPNSSERETSEQIRFDLDPGETTRFKHKTEMLPYQGTAAITVDTIQLSQNDDYIKVLRSRNTPYRLYTFMVYDRDYYKVNYLWPRRTQYVAAVLSILIILVGALQAYLAFTGG